MNPLEITPEYRKADNSGPLVKVSVAFVVLETLFVILFLISRSINKKLHGIDLWLVLSSYACSLGLCILGFLFVYLGGAGRHLLVLYQEAPHEIVATLKIQFAAQHTWLFGVTLPKLAILCLYLQVFAKGVYRRTTQFLIFFLVINCATWLTVGFTICRPLAYNWDKTIQGGHCGNLGLVFKLASVPNIVTDVAMLILPIPMIWNLHVDMAQKIGLTITFVTGSLGIVTTIIRLYEFFGVDLFEDVTYNCITTMVWTVIEAGCYFIAATMLNLRPLWQHVKKSNAYSSFRSGLARFTGHRLRRYDSGDSTTIVERKWSRDTETESDVSDSPPVQKHNQILVTRAYDVETCSNYDGPGCMWVRSSQR